MPEITIDRPDGPMQTYLAVPGGRGPWPGVVVVHDALGMTTDLRRQADWLASTGYLAVAPDLYYRGGRLRCLVATLRSFVEGEGPAFDDLEATRSRLAGRSDCTGITGVLGFCMGGGFALALATTGRYAASSVNYGMVDDPATALADACPVVASFGGRDRSTGDFPQQLVAALDERDIPYDVKVYGAAGHAFMNDHSDAEMVLWARVAMRLVNGGHHAPSEADARRRIIAFFDRWLRPAA